MKIFAYGSQRNMRTRTCVCGALLDLLAATGTASSKASGTDLPVRSGNPLQSQLSLHTLLPLFSHSCLAELAQLHSLVDGTGQMVPYTEKKNRLASRVCQVRRDGKGQDPTTPRSMGGAVWGMRLGKHARGVLVVSVCPSVCPLDCMQTRCSCEGPCALWATPAPHSNAWVVQRPPARANGAFSEATFAPELTGVARKLVHGKTVTAMSLLVIICCRSLRVHLTAIWL